MIRNPSSKTTRPSSKRSSSESQQLSSEEKTLPKGPKALSERSRARLSASTQSPPAGRKGKIPDDKRLRVIGHQLKTCVIITESSLVEGELGPAIVKETKARLEDHELIKVKIRFLDRHDRQKVLQNLLEGTGARLVHGIGKVALIFKASTQFSEKLSNIERYRRLI